MIKCQQSLVFIGEEAWAEFEQMLERFADLGQKVYILADENTAEHCVQRLQSVHGVISENLLVVEAGEQTKNLEVAYQLWSELLESGADRKSVLLNIGGGVITDLGGFVASTFKRGITFVKIPTSLMAMADAAIGGKTGINLDTAKNQVGTFAWADSVLVMPEMLESLPEIELSSGYAECIKHGLLSGSELFNELTHSAPKPLSEELLEQIVRIKVDVVNGDPLETGNRKSLNLGHTVGHAIESTLLEQGKLLPHGHCVLMGLIAELKMAELELGLNPMNLQQLIGVANSSFSELKGLELDTTDLLRYMQMDKKNEQGQMRFALLKEIGNCQTDVALASDVVESGLKFLKEWLVR